MKTIQLQLCVFSVILILSSQLSSADQGKYFIRQQLKKYNIDGVLIIKWTIERNTL